MIDIFDVSHGLSFSMCSMSSYCDDYWYQYMESWKLNADCWYFMFVLLMMKILNTTHRDL